MTQQLTHRQIAWRVAQDLPRGAHVRLGAGMPLLVPDYVAADSGVMFEHGADAIALDYCVLGAREVAQNGDFVTSEVAQHSPSAAVLPDLAAKALHVFVMAAYFAPDGRPTLVPQCTLAPSAARCVTTLFTDIAVIDLRDGKAWLREIVEGITLHVLQSETDVQLHVAPDLRLLHAPERA